MLKKSIAAVTLALLASSPFAAEPGSFYAGLDVGRASLDRAGDATSFGGILGYNISKHWAVEGAVRNMGKYDVFGGDIKATQASVSGVGTVTIGKGFDFFGRVGYNHISVDNNSRFVTLNDDSLDGINFGLGFAYHFTPAVAARIEVQQAASDLSSVSAGVVFTF